MNQMNREEKFAHVRASLSNFEEEMNELAVKYPSFAKARDEMLEGKNVCRSSYLEEDLSRKLKWEERHRDKIQTTQLKQRPTNRKTSHLSHPHNKTSHHAANYDNIEADLNTVRKNESSGYMTQVGVIVALSALLIWAYW